MTFPITPRDEAEAKLEAMITLAVEQASDFPIYRYPVTVAEAQEEVQASVDAFGLDVRENDIDYLVGKLYERTEIGMIPADGAFTGHDFFDEVSFIDLLEEAQNYEDSGSTVEAMSIISDEEPPLSVVGSGGWVMNEAHRDVQNGRRLVDRLGLSQPAGLSAGDHAASVDSSMSDPGREDTPTHEL